MQDFESRININGRLRFPGAIRPGATKAEWLLQTVSPTGRSSGLWGGFWGIFYIFLILAIAIMSGHLRNRAAGASPEISAILAKAEGEVSVCLSRESTWRLVGAGFPLEQGDRVRTGKGSWGEIRFYKGDIPTGWLRLEPEGELIIDRMLLENLPAKDESSLLSQLTFKIRFILGRIYVKVAKQLLPALKFEVETPAASIGVRGTFFAVYVLPSGVTGVSVEEGLVEVVAQKKSVTPGAGQETVVHPGMPPQEPGPMSEEEKKGWQELGRWLEEVEEEAREATGKLMEKGKKGKGKIKEKTEETEEEEEIEEIKEETKGKLGNLKDNLPNPPFSDLPPSDDLAPGLLNIPGTNGKGVPGGGKPYDIIPGGDVLELATHLRLPRLHMFYMCPGLGKDVYKFAGSGDHL